jgi:hypothetical protein
VTVSADSEESAIESVLETFGENLLATAEEQTFRVTVRVIATYTFEFTDAEGEYDGAFDVQSAFENGNLDFEEYIDDPDSSDIEDVSVEDTV